MPVEIENKLQLTDEKKSEIQKKTQREAERENSGESFTCLLPPPNVTGSLHMGHALPYITSDVFCRYHKIKGKNVLLQMGFDHGGIATQLMINKKCGEDHAEEWVKESKEVITNQVKKLNIMAKWSRLCFTLDKERSEIVTKCFVELYKAGLIYKGRKIVNWDVSLKTAISDLEVVYKEEKQDLYSIIYKGKGFSITVATTRPETIFADVALAVHPTDIRYSNFIGKKVTIPLCDREIPIIPSTKVDITFGTGVLKVTPAHSFIDYEIGKTAKLPVIDIIDEDGKLYGEYVPEQFRGLSTRDVRKMLQEYFPRESILSKVPYGDRSHSIIEPRITDQWFFHCKDLGLQATEYVKQGKIVIHPKFWENEYFSWNNHLDEWCISRQIWWGHKIPVWYDEKGNEYCAETREEAEKISKSTLLTQEKGVLDTWFSSALYNISALQGTDATDLVVTGYDILAFWINRMIIMDYFFKDRPAFKNIIFTRLIRDSQGKKLSKTTGNGVDPMVVINSNEFGTDTLRCSLMFESTVHHDLRIDIEKIEKMGRFITKLRNSAKYLLMSVQKPKLNNITCGNNIFSHYVVHSINQLEEEYDREMESLENNKAFFLLYQFIWDKYCKWFIEIHKIIQDEEYSHILYWAFGKLLRLLHPTAPEITELLWETMGFTSDKSISIIEDKYLEKINFDPKILDKINNIFSLNIKLRRLKQILDIRSTTSLISTDNKEMKDILRKNKEVFKKFTGIMYTEFPSSGYITIEVNQVKWKFECPHLTSDYMENRRVHLRTLYVREKERNSEEAAKIDGEIKELDNLINTLKYT